ncbi:MAG: coat protein [Cressdnaviricota sp.]|nr:MAG: coat protein [Cressdnaviricota sp.]
MPRAAAAYKPSASRKVAARRVAAPARRAPARASRAAPVRRVAVRRPASRGGSMFSSAGSGLGGLAGGALGGPAGAAIGTILGKLGGGMIGKIFGHGDYTVSNVDAIKKNNLITNGAQIPQFGTGKVAVNFTHREFLGDVISSATPGAFRITDYAINPGIVSTFPWLSQVVGASFQQYRINGMTFEYRSMSADALNSTNTALGSVIMSTDYDSADLTFGSKQEMENTEYGVSCKPSVNMMHGIECARAQTPMSELYIRPFAVPNNKDIRMYDMGRFSIATVGLQAASVNLGELWVSYDIDAFKAIEQVPLYIAPIAQYNLNSVDATHAFGLTQSVKLDNQGTSLDRVGLTFVNSGSYNQVQFPYNIEVNSIWQFTYYLYGASTAVVPYAPVTVSNGFVVIADFVGVPYTGVMTSAIKAQTFKMSYTGGATPAAPPTVTIGNGIVPATITNATVSVAQISGGFLANGSV